jgi:hypothetical protein
VFYFVRKGHTLLKMVPGMPSALNLIPLPELTWASGTKKAKAEANDNQKLEMVMEGWECCKFTWGFFNN